jgi:hypothetical protein
MGMSERFRFVVSYTVVLHVICIGVKLDIQCRESSVLEEEGTKVLLIFFNASYKL